MQHIICIGPNSNQHGVKKNLALIHKRILFCQEQWFPVEIGNTVRPWDACFLGNEKTHVAQIRATWDTL